MGSLHIGAMNWFSIVTLSLSSSDEFPCAAGCDSRARHLPRDGAMDMRPERKNGFAGGRTREWDCRREREPIQLMAGGKTGAGQIFLIQARFAAITQLPVQAHTNDVD
jgi:hypothetical protein